MAKTIQSTFQDVEKAREQEKIKILTGEMTITEARLLSEAEIDDVRRVFAQQERQKPFWKRLFHKQSRPFPWQDPCYWQDVEFQSGDTMIFTHRIDLEYLTPAQEEEVREGLAQYRIQYDERRASSTVGNVHKNDRTLRIRDPKSIEILRSMVFRWAMGPQAKPITMSADEYFAPKAVRSVPVAAKPRRTPAPAKTSDTTDTKFDWTNSVNWHDVQFRSQNKVLCSHRLNLKGLTPEQIEEIRAGLHEYHINFEERQATRTMGSIHKGDPTIRISDAKSIQQLRTMVFQWVSGPYARPVSMTEDEYQEQQRQKQIRFTRDFNRHAQD